MTGTILRGVGGFYEVMESPSGDRFTLRAQAKLRRLKLKPMVGDQVVFTPGEGDAEGWLEEILPRKNSLARPPVANIGVIAAIIASAQPKPDLMLVDRLLISARMAGIEVCLAINKLDEDAGAAADIAGQYALSGAPVYQLSALGGEGIEDFRAALSGRITALAGQSGVGKSTLINALYGLDLKTGELSGRIDRGKHTTRHSELIPVGGGGMIIDTPGFSLLEIGLIDPVELSRYMPEFERYEGECRFHPCSHVSEVDCAVRAAAGEGAISGERHQRYCAIYTEMNTRWRDRYG